MSILSNNRIAIVHDWLTGMRGGEKCLEIMCQQWPQAKLYTLIHTPGKLSAPIERMDIRTSFLQRLPGISKYYRYTLPIMPWAARWPISQCDLLLSSSHAVAKAAVAPRGVPHVCYCYSPMRYAWQMQESYFAQANPLKRQVAGRILKYIRQWDKANSAGVTHFIAISQYIRQRIQACYQRDADVIYPPVDTTFYCPDQSIPREDYFLILSAFAPYKRLDLAIEACNRLKAPLVIIGSGQDEAKLKALAGPTVQFLGWQPSEVLRDHLRRCRALLFPGEEDFGIVPVEANACGTPVVAYAKGGATETIVPAPRADATGVWFEEQTVDSLIAALEPLLAGKIAIGPGACRQQALKFDEQVFTQGLVSYCERVVSGRVTG